MPSGKQEPIIVLSDSDLDPEFAAIQAAAEKSARARAVNATSSVVTNVTIRFKLIPHPMDESGATKIYAKEMSDVSVFAGLPAPQPLSYLL